MRPSHACSRRAPAWGAALAASSSSSLYGDAPVDPHRRGVDHPAVSPYEVTKLASEQLCLASAG
jgi:nucleoside-diphosphate-sugar epimerase